MPTWGELLNELKEVAKPNRLPPGVSGFDFLRRKYLKKVAAHTGRNTILYSSAWVQPNRDAALTSISPEDIHGFMEVVHGLNGDELDLVLHSPGGSAEATESVVLYLRSKFKNIRVFVPHAAMSSATMLCCSADTIVMGAHSFLGPVDPQVMWRADYGPVAIPAHAILDQFDQAKEECANPAALPVWAPILQRYSPALIAQCNLALKLSKDLVECWLRDYLFRNQDNAPERAKAAAEALTSKEIMSHGRFLHRDYLRQKVGLEIENLEDDQKLQDAVLSVYHATAHTFSGTPAHKIIENHLGSAFVKLSQHVQMGPMPMIQKPPLPK